MVKINQSIYFYFILDVLEISCYLKEFIIAICWSFFVNQQNLNKTTNLFAWYFFNITTTISIWEKQGFPPCSPTSHCFASVNSSTYLQRVENQRVRPEGRYGNLFSAGRRFQSCNQQHALTQTPDRTALPALGVNTHTHTQAAPWGWVETGWRHGALSYGSQCSQWCYG